MNFYNVFFNLIYKKINKASPSLFIEQLIAFFLTRQKLNKKNSFSRNIFNLNFTLLFPFAIRILLRLIDFFEIILHCNILIKLKCTIFSTYTFLIMVCTMYDFYDSTDTLKF